MTHLVVWMSVLSFIFIILIVVHWAANNKMQRGKLSLDPNAVKVLMQV